MLGNDLYVAVWPGGHTGMVGEYNATGTAFNADFIPGLNEPVSLAVSSVPEPSPWSMIAVGATALLGIMLRKNPIKPIFITGLNGPSGLALSGNNLFVSNVGSGTVDEYDTITGAVNPNFTTITGLTYPANLAVSGNTLFVSDQDAGTVGEYDLNAETFNRTFIMGLSQPVGLAVASVPEPSAWSIIGVGGVALLGMMLRKKHRSA